MISEWKTKLFEPDSKEPPEHLIYPVSTAEGKRILGISHETWQRWEKVALQIPEYKLIQQRMRKLASSKKRFTPIIAYQIWVMGEIGELYSKMPNGLEKVGLVKEAIAYNKENLTRKAYEEEQARYTSMALTA